MELDTGDKIWALFGKLSELETTLARLETKVDGLHDESRDVDKRFEELERRVGRLEKSLLALIALAPALGGGAAKVLDLLL